MTVCKTKQEGNGESGRLGTREGNAAVNCDEVPAALLISTCIKGIARTIQA